MVMTTAEKFAEHNGRIGKLEHSLAEIKALLTELTARLPPAPKPPERVPQPPKWAGSGGENTGSSYCGPPSAPTTGGETWVRERRENGDWRDPSGHWRDSSGQLVPAVSPPRPAGPERTPAHQQAIELLDRLAT
jgi:hypothetical protein